MDNTLIVAVAAFAIIILGTQVQIVKLQQRIKNLEGIRK